MGRSLCPSFESNHGGDIQDANARFRQPRDTDVLKCRLGIKSGIQKKGVGYQPVKLIKDTVGNILQCPTIGPNGECAFGGWCQQFNYDNVQVKSNK